MKNLKKMSAMIITVAMVLSLVTISVSAEAFDITYTFRDAKDSSKIITSVEAGEDFYLDINLPEGSYRNGDFEFEYFGTVADEDIECMDGAEVVNDAGWLLVGYSATFNITSDKPMIRIKMTVPEGTEIGAFTVLKAIGLTYTTTADGKQNPALKEAVIEVAEAPPVVIDPPVITVENVMARPGKEINVDIILEKNTGFADLNIEVGYDADIMTLTNAESASEVGGTYTSAEDYTVNPYNMSWDSATNILYDGVIATLSFVVKDDVAEGIYPITIDYYKGIDGDYIDGEDINYDENEKAVGFVYVDGSVKVYKAGDIKSDGKVNSKDATYMLRYLADWNMTELTDFNADAIDVDASGIADNKDVILLLRYLAGWDVTLN